MELDFLSVVGVLQALTLGGVSLAVLVVILTEVVKEFAGLQGKAVRAVALSIGFVLTAVAYGVAEGLIPAAAGPYIEWVFVAVVGGLGGMGLWHLGKRFLSTNAVVMPQFRGGGNPLLPNSTLNINEGPNGASSVTTAADGGVEWRPPVP